MSQALQVGDRVLVTWQGTSDRETATVQRIGDVWITVQLDGGGGWPCGSDELMRLPVDLHAACPYCGADEPTIDVEDRDEAVGYSAIETRCAACWHGASC